MAEKKELIEFSFINLPAIESIIIKYRPIFADLEGAKDILNAYNLKQPMTSVEIYGVTGQSIKNFIDEISPYFFYWGLYYAQNKDRIPLNARGLNLTARRKYDVILYLSRFHTIITIIEKLNGLTDAQADLYGLFCGKSLSDIYSYCKREDLTHLIR